jgi:hypothetical protein
MTNVDTAVRVANVTSALRRQLPQIRTFPLKPERVCLVGGGPSLESTLPELRELVWGGAMLVTTNGAYRWCIDHNLKPNAQIVLDARDCNASFLHPEVPGCRYYLASQCHPSTFEAVEGRPWVALYHAVGEDYADIEVLLKAHYHGRYHMIGGGSTVVMRGLAVLRTLGYFKFDLFGVDSCWLDDQHHAFPQAQNAKDKRLRLEAHPAGQPERKRVFHVAPWHVKQLEDFLRLLKDHGSNFLINVHGPGLLAFAISSNAEVDAVIDDDGASSGDQPADQEQ